MKLLSPPNARPVRRPVTLIALASVALLSACASLAPAGGELPETPLPAAWSSTPVNAAAVPSPTALAGWWQRFNDPTLTTLVTQALQANTSVKSAQAALLQARAQRDVQQAGMGPTLGVSASAQRGKSGNNDASNRFQAGFDASWEPDVFGGNRSALSASEADTRASETSLADVQVSLAAEVAVNYIELRSLQTRLAIARSNLAAQTETLQITRWRTQAGLASSLDLEQAIASSEQTAAQLPALQTSIAQALSGLAVLTGQAPGTLPAALQSALTTAAPVPQGAGDLALAFPAETLRQRPDVRTAEHRISAALSRVAAADAARYPSFRLSGSLGLSALTLGTLTNGASVASSLLASVSAPLFDGGAARAQVRAGDQAADAKSLVALLQLGLREGDAVRVSAEGADAPALLAALRKTMDGLVAQEKADAERAAQRKTAPVAGWNPPEAQAAIVGIGASPGLATAPAPAGAGLPSWP